MLPFAGLDLEIILTFKDQFIFMGDFSAYTAFVE
jgi:hypothetical protein